MSVQQIAFILTVIAASFATAATAQYDYYATVSDCGHGGWCDGGDDDSYGRVGWLGALQGEGYWTVRAGALFLRREAPRDANILYALDAGLNTTPSITTQDIDVDFETGWEAAAQYELCYGYLAEVRYFEVDDLTDSINTLLPAAGQGIISNTGNFFGLIDPVLASNVVGSVFFDSTLKSAEANLRGDLGRVQTIAGFRYVKLDENLLMNITQPILGGFNNFFYRTENDLYGFQVGLEIAAMPEYHPLQIDCVGKIGVYYNDFTIRNGNTTNAVGATNSNNRLTADTTSAVAELSLLGSYEITGNLSVQAGVHALWLNNVVEPADQIAANGDPDIQGLTGYDDSGTPFFVGIFTGFQFVH